MDQLRRKIENFFSDKYLLSDTGIIRFESEIIDIEPILWLMNQTSKLKTYWSDREGKFQLAGIGEADIISSNTLDEFQSSLKGCSEKLKDLYPDLKYYGGMCFNRHGTGNNEWREFCNYRFHIPECEVYRKNGKTLFALNYHNTGEKSVNEILRDIHELIDRINFSIGIKVSTLPMIIERKDLTVPEDWKKKINRIKEDIKKKEYKKLVLAKKSIFKLEEDLDPGLITYLLNRNKMNSYTFYFQPAEDISFVGNSPELLYKRDGDKIVSEALAGTRERGENEDDDARIEKELLTSVKDRNEHKIVQDYIQDTLVNLSKTELEESSVTVLKLPKVQHLFCRMSSLLKEGINDFDILSNLHPTPAVGGYPKEASLKRITDIEDFNRGWYGGAIGWIGNESAEFAVGIRSGLICNSELTLFAGAGIVQRSDPEEEWNETENKMLNFLRFFEFK
ncbi:MAG: isochorismate synthase [bacterium]|nr:isochorismate synthase [bacterium]